MGTMRKKVYHDQRSSIQQRAANCVSLYVLLHSNHYKEQELPNCELDQIVDFCEILANFESNNDSLTG